MEWVDGEPCEHKVGFEAPDMPGVFKDIVNAQIEMFASHELVEDNELRYLESGELGAGGLAAKLYEQFEENAKSPVSKEDFQLLELTVVPPMFTTAENAMMASELDGAYITNDSYAYVGTRLRMLNFKTLDPVDRTNYIDNIVYLQLADENSDQNVVEFFYDQASGQVDVKIMIEGWQEERRPATALQKVELGRMLHDLLELPSPEA